MEAITIEVSSEKQKSGREARRMGLIPVVCYGRGLEPKHFTVEYQTFRKAYRKAGKSTIIQLVDEKKNEYPVLVQDIQYHPVTDDMIHIDLIAIRKDQKINAKVPLVFVGDAPAIRELGGIFVCNKDSVAIECLPKDLPHEIQVDVSSLIDFHTSLTVGDIKVPEGITITDAKEISIAIISAPRKEEDYSVKPATPAEGEVAPAEGEKKPEEAAAADKKPEKKGKE